MTRTFLRSDRKRTIDRVGVRSGCETRSGGSHIASSCGVHLSAGRGPALRCGVRFGRDAEIPIASMVAVACDRCL